MKKKMLCVVLCVLMLLQLLPVAVGADGVTCSPVYRGTNANGNEYTWNWAAPMESYLAVTAEGMLMRVQWGALEGKLLVEYFDSAYQYQYSLTVEGELPIFGGFHAGTDGCYYVVTGQNNYDEQADVECFRITKYDSRWNRLGSAGVYDCNTTVPFDAGSLRFAEYGKFLLIRTAHEMYTTSDGLNHQANVTLSLDTLSMTIADTACEVEFYLSGYVSHSFNQFILVDGGRLVALDHGDAYPRSIAMTQAVLPEDGTLGIYDKQGYFRGIPEEYNLFTFPGEIGANYTGACIGGFECSDSAYVVAFNTVKQDENYRSNRTKNVCIATMDKETDEIRILPVTEYPEGEETAGVPQLVKLTEDSFLLMWMRGGDLQYVLLNGDGETVGEVQIAPDGKLSDCAPIVMDGKAVWYVYQDNAVTFYEIHGETLAYGAHTVSTSHHWQVVEYPAEAGGLCRGVCLRCGVEESFATPESLELVWGYKPTELYYSDYEFQWFVPFEVGTVLYWRVRPSANVTLTCSDPEGLVIDPVDGTLLCAKEGKYTLTLNHEYNPYLTFTVKIAVGHKYRYECDTVCQTCGHVREAGHIPGELILWEYPTCTTEGVGVTNCIYCFEELTREPIPPAGHSFGTWYVDMNPTCTESGAEKRWCRDCYTYETRELPATGHHYDPYVTSPTCTKKGYTTYACRCGDCYVVDETPAIGHSGPWFDTVPGKEGRYCAVCGAFESREKEPNYDVDGNGSVEEADLTLLLSVLVGNTEMESLFDPDFDGMLTIYDCVLLAKQLSVI